MNRLGHGGDYLGSYRPGNSAAHRMPLWAKYLVVLLVGVVPFIWRRWWLSIGCAMLAVVIILVVARLPSRAALRLGPALWVMNALILVYHVFLTTWQNGVAYVGAIMAAIYTARMLTCTTDPGRIMDATAAVARPFRLLGAKPEKFALTIAIMWTTIPYLLSSFVTVKDAARARGLEKQTWRFLIPFVVGAVGHALELGEALQARGLGEDEQERAPRARTEATAEAVSE